jgi:hypothetical protein
MNSGLSRDELLVIFVVSFSVFLLTTYWKIRAEEMSKHEAVANEEDTKEETDKTDEER